MSDTVDRSQDFYDGSESVRTPSFRPVRLAPYRRTSTLDNLFPTGNGMGQKDTQRAMMGLSRSSIGQSQDTYDKSLWIQSSQQPVARDLYSKNYE